MQVTEAQRSTSGEPAAGREHILSLDGVRGLAIALVMVYHQTLLHKVSAELPLLDAAFARLAGTGWCGVDLFFVLSGFLITGILVDSKSRPHYFRNFYARRTLRIFPLYYAVVFLSLVVIPNLPATLLPPEKAASLGRIGGDEIWYWLYLSNYAVAAAGEWRHGILDISWSLAIEEQFYLLWPSLVWWLDRKRLSQLCGGVFLGALALRIVLVASEANPMAAYVLTPARLDGLAVGSWLAIVARTPAGLGALTASARRVLWAAVAGLASLFAVRGGLNAMDPWVATAGYSLFALGFGALLVLVLTARPHTALRRFFEHPFLRWLGKYSYALYLFHLPLRAALRDSVYAPEQFLVIAGSYLPGQLIFYAGASALASAAAWVSWNVYEKRLLALKRYF